MKSIIIIIIIIVIITVTIIIIIIIINYGDFVTWLSDFVIYVM